jgi:transcriptional regulator with XRE-family HTH domain
MIGMAEGTGRRELGAFVRSHRERLQPDAVGIEAGRRRRTPGLRREELAQLAGVSATWLSWIEQGRDVSASPGALARLAGVLRLTAAERAYLFDLASRRDPAAAGESPLGDLADTLAAVVAVIASPAYALDRAWNALAWNTSARRLFVGWLDGPPTPNLLRYVFLEPAAKKLIEDWEGRARRLAAEFRADYSRHLAAPDTQAVVSELRSKSPLFAQAWEAHAVVDREGGERTFNHPGDGLVRYEQATFLVARHQDIKLVVLTPKR